jgi:hypothetical protein
MMQGECNRMDETRFWSMIEAAWNAVDGAAAAARERLARGELDEASAQRLAHQSWAEVVPALRAALKQLSKNELLQFDRILERKLFDIDRSEIQEHTDGSDDGFLYCRGFVVAAGQGYYNAVNQDPSRAMMELECEDQCYLPGRLYSEKFGDMPQSDISRESMRNPAGWTNESD